VTTRRLRVYAMVALVAAVVLFVTTVQALQWIALVLVLVAIGILMWTLFTSARENAR
jgi:diacylglycerol kinase